MIRGTTPLHTFVFPKDINENYTNILITYRQNDKIIMEKELSDLNVFENMAKLRITQDESLSFDDGRGYVQLKVFTVDKHVLGSAAFSFPVTSSLTKSKFDENGNVIKPTDPVCECSH